MLKFQIIGYVGKDAVVQQHGTECVINFSVCHTDKYKDASGQKYEKATWVSCSWWTDRVSIAQHIKKGTLLWVEGIPEAKQWKNGAGEYKAYLNMRVARIDFLGGKREDNNTSNDTPAQNNSTEGYKPMETGTTGEDFSGLPF